MYVTFFGAVLICCVLFYLLIFPLKRFFGSLCSPLEAVSGNTIRTLNEQDDPNQRTEQILKLYKSTEVHPRLIKIIFIYMMIGYVSSMAAGGIIYLINTTIIPRPQLQADLIQKFILFGAVFGVCCVGIARISATCYSILPVRLLLFYFGGVVAFLALYAVLNPAAFTEITDIAIRPQFGDLLVFVFALSVGISVCVEIGLSIARKKWLVASRSPMQLTTEIRESYEEQKYALGLTEVARLILDTLESESRTGIKEVCWVTFDGPEFFAEELRDKLVHQFEIFRLGHPEDNKVDEREFVKRRVKVICPREIGRKLAETMPAEYRCPKAGSTLGNFRFIIFNSNQAIIYFPVPYGDIQPANVAQLITLAYRVQCLRSHFLDWWSNCDKVQ